LWAVAGLLLSTAAWCRPGDGLAGTRHDFSGEAGGASGLCNFCHTPHKARTQALLWNHSLSQNTFTWELAQTAAGTPYPSFGGDVYTGTTAKCLSCHDGSVAIGDLVWWNGGPARVNDDRISGGARMATATGTIEKNHPVAMPYPFSNTASTYNGVRNGGGLQLTQWVADPTAVGIALYNDDGSGLIRPGPQVGRSGIECSSCHDPHNGAAVEDDRFLRGTRGGICEKCHAR
jgi:predicted CXXCH cytochrome family protein